VAAVSGDRTATSSSGVAAASANMTTFCGGAAITRGTYNAQTVQCAKPGFGN